MGVLELCRGNFWQEIWFNEIYHLISVLVIRLSNAEVSYVSYL